MIKVLIVEDERHTARFIAQLVDQHPGFTAVGMAANGQEALAFLEKNPVDLLITDIRMPVMDGMELLKHVYQQFPQCMTVVLSGYSDFAYTKVAIQNQALDYLLKPVDKTELFQLLDKVLMLWSQRSWENLHAQIQQALDGNLLPQDSTQQVYLLLTHASHCDPEPVFGPGCHLFTGAAEQLLVVEEDIEVPELAEAFHQSLQQDTPVQVICTKTAIPLWTLHTAVSQLRSILEQRVRMFQSRLLLVDPMEPQSVRTGIPLRDLHPDRAVEAICTKNQAELRACLAEVLEIPNLRRMDMQNYLDAVVSDSRLAYHMPPGRPNQLKTVLAETIARATEPASCAQALAMHLLALKNEPAAKRDVADIVEEIAQQMNANCHLPFTTEALAKQYGFMPRYLNKVFKEHKGLRPMEYLLSLRMKRAKFMLETVPDALIKDVANSVGYTDPLYFSKMFKRETGLWPKEVQQTARK